MDKIMPKNRRKMAGRLVGTGCYQIEVLKDTYGITFKQMAQELDIDYDDLMAFRKAETDGFDCAENTVTFMNYLHRFEMDLKELRNMVNYLSLRLRLLRKQDKILEEWKAL